MCVCLVIQCQDMALCASRASKRTLSFSKPAKARLPLEVKATVAGGL